MTNEYMLTTFDNPYDYFTQFVEWNLYDVEQGYNTCCYLARFANISDDMTQKEENEEIERAIDDIIEHDVFNIYKKVQRSTA